MAIASSFTLVGWVWLSQAQGAVPPPVSAPATPVAVDAPDVAEAPITDGNVVAAKKVALDAAFLAAVERVFAAELADAGFAAPASLPDELAKLRASFPSTARRYVRSYRVVEELEADGKFKVALAAVVDRAILRRHIERSRSAGPVLAPDAARVYVVASEGAVSVAPALTEALRAAGLPATEVPAGTATSGIRIALRGQTQLDGEVRGAGLVAARCQLDMSLRAASGSRDIVLPSASEWGFGAQPALAQKACVDRLAPLAAKWIVPAAHEMAAAPAAKAVHVSFALQEPVALEHLLRRLRRVGTVTRYELRRIAVGVADVRMETNLSAEALGTALQQILSDELALTVDQASGDQLRMSLNMRAGVGPGPALDEPLEPQ